MQEFQAQKMVRETLEQPFNKVRFSVLVKNLLNKMNEKKALLKPYVGQFISEGFRDSIGIRKTVKKEVLALMWVFKK